MVEKRTVLLLSGGLDSGSLLFCALHDNWSVSPLFVDYGQTTRPGEWQAVCALLDLAGLPGTEPVVIPGIAHLGAGTLASSQNNSSAYFPSRNLMLVTLAAMYAFTNDVSHIMIGLISDAASSLPDCSQQYVDSVQTVLQIEYPQLGLRAPFLGRSKKDIVREAISYGLVPELTFSCNSLANHHCWECSSCLDRLRILRELNLIDMSSHSEH